MPLSSPFPRAAALLVGADALAAVDAQVVAVLAIRVPADVTVGTLQADVAAMQQALNTWPTALRAPITQAMQQLVSTNTQYAQQMGTGTTLLPAALAAFLQTTQVQVRQLAMTLTGLQSALGTWSTALNTSVGALTNDAQTVTQQIQTDSAEIADNQGRLAASQAEWNAIMASRGGQEGPPIRPCSNRCGPTG